MIRVTMEGRLQRHCDVRAWHCPVEEAKIVGLRRKKMVNSARPPSGEALCENIADLDYDFPRSNHVASSTESLGRVIVEPPDLC